MMKQELPQLVDERRFRRREQEQVERDEFGRVSTMIACCLPDLLTQHSGNGPRRKSPSIWSRFPASICELKSLATADPMSNISSKRPAAVSKLRAEARDILRFRRGAKATRICFFMLRKQELFF